jgi:CDP-diglyceride synthetase
MQNFIIGIAGFSVIALAVIGLKTLLSAFGLGTEAIANTIMVLMLLGIAPMFGELTKSVFKLNK